MPGLGHGLRAPRSMGERNGFAEKKGIVTIGRHPVNAPWPPARPPGPPGPGFLSKGIEEAADGWVHLPGRNSYLVSNQPEIHHEQVW